MGGVSVTEGDEVITSPITDMGTVIGILYQNAIPVFADLDPHTYKLDAKSVESRISDKTKAIVVVHLAGNPADMDAIMDVARRHNLRVVEDCAQSYMCFYKGRLAGTIGDIGCFSLNDFKHISAGDGGMVVMNDEELYIRAFRFADKNYNRFNTKNLRDIPFVAPNYRMNELTAAVGIAQLDKLVGICERRNAHGDRLTQMISGIKGLYPPKVESGNMSSYWFYLLRIDPVMMGCTNVEFATALKAEGILCGAGYIPQCVYEYDLFINKSAYPGTHAPFDSPYYGREIEYGHGLCPIAEKILATSVKLNINEFYTEGDINDMAEAIKKVSEYYLSR
jgi:dTDP-4-amino-4,6-dideoxygalactose transaminase